MPELAVKRDIHARIDVVFAHATDFAGAADAIGAITRVEVLTDGPVGRGTRFRETRVMFGREASEEMEVVEFEPPRRYVLGCDSHGCRYRSEFRLTDKGGGVTQVEMTFAATPLTLPAKVMSFLMRPMMKKMAAECLKDLDDLKATIKKKAAS